MNKEAIELCTSIDVHRKTHDFEIMELTLFDRVGALSQAIDSSTLFLSANPDDIAVRARLAIYLYRLDYFALLEEQLSILVESTSLSLSEGTSIVKLLHNRGRTHDALKLSYELRRSNFEVPEAHFQFAMLCMGPQIKAVPFPEVNEVLLDSALQVQPSNGSLPVWYVIVDRRDATIKHHELDVQSDLSKKLLGNRVGDTIEITSAPFPEECTVLRVVHKHVFALEESVSLLTSVYGGSGLLKRVPVNDESATAFRDSLREMSGVLDNASLVSELLQAWRERKIPIGFVASRFGFDLAGFWTDLIRTNERKGVWTSSLEEQAAAAALLEMHTKLVVDLTSLVLVKELNALDSLLLGPQLLVSQSVIDALTNEIMVSSQNHENGRMSMGFVDGEPQVSHQTADKCRRHTEHLIVLKEWILHNCKLCPVLAPIPEVDKTELEGVLGAELTDSILLAMEYDCPLYCDDVASLAFARREYGVAGVWTQDVFSMLNRRGLDNEYYGRVVLDLVELHFRPVSITGAALVVAAEMADWTLQPPLSKLVAVLADNNTKNSSIVGVLSYLLYRLWLVQLSEMKRNVLVFSVLNSIRGKLDKSTLALLRVTIRQQFKLNPLGESELLEVIGTWLKEKGTGLYFS
ncbi:hypothetical protein IT575_14585 [bacterium]|nr:hypothetical protein [bacterium]